VGVVFVGGLRRRAAAARAQHEDERSVFLCCERETSAGRDRRGRKKITFRLGFQGYKAQRKRRRKKKCKIRRPTPIIIIIIINIYIYRDVCGVRLRVRLLKYYALRIHTTNARVFNNNYNELQTATLRV